ncbi:MULTISPECIES: DUF4307 domain-containing protein [Microbacterium]|uniref:DUF4307 domain-containing protein n=1 Tax=Microbacterium trichothecenolyticum TaxID=69370 RepID=A0A0M2HDY5_MICTR|nr:MULTISPECIES: DUF4307 domain-containing protein [Microbacterium]KJL44829.1 hypothetical protein RS82_00552 [Microbacterium trichothecenolyticum]MDR7190810.1 hypothetical protein [Microbacterium sp. BE35]
MTTQDMLDERYGRRRSPARAWLIGAGIVVAVGVVGLFGWFTVRGSLNSVDSDTTSFEVVDEHSVMLGFQISNPPGAAVACAIEAQDEEHGVVGWRIVELPASDLHARAFREAIPTTALATTGFVNSCWVLPG